MPFSLGAWRGQCRRCVWANNGLPAVAGTCLNPVWVYIVGPVILHRRGCWNATSVPDCSPVPNRSMDEGFIVKITGHSVAISGCSGRMSKFGVLLGLKLANTMTATIDGERLVGSMRGEMS